MEIFWLGHAALRLRDKNLAIVTDPFDPKMVGLSFPKVTADIVTISHEHEDHNFTQRVIGDPKVLRGPGEYEVKGTAIRGIATWHDSSKGSQRGRNTVFVTELDGVKIAHLGDLGHKLTEDQVGELGTVDVLVIPVGGVYTIGPQLAAEVVAQLEPKVVIPMHYQVPGLNASVFGKLADVTQFIKAMGMIPKRMSSYQFRQDSLPEEMELVILERRG